MISPGQSYYFGFLFYFFIFRFLFLPYYFLLFLAYYFCLTISVLFLLSMPYQWSEIDDKVLFRYDLICYTCFTNCSFSSYKLFTVVLNAYGLSYHV